MQFLSHKLDYELIDIVDDDGCASDIVDYAHNELGIDLRYLPISTYEAESLFAVDTLSDAVVHATPDDANGDWNYEVLNTSFYGYMVAAVILAATANVRFPSQMWSFGTLRPIPLNRASGSNLFVMSYRPAAT